MQPYCFSFGIIIYKFNSAAMQSQHRANFLQSFFNLFFDHKEMMDA